MRDAQVPAASRPYRLPMEGGSLALLNELDVMPPTLQSPSGQPFSSPPDESSQPPEQCVSLALLSAGTDVDHALEQLRALGLLPVLHEITRIERIDLWVHLPPAGSRRAAEVNVQKVRAAGIESFVIGGGDLENGISLGIFSSTENAESKVAEALAAGLQPVIKELPRFYIQLEVAIPSRQQGLVDDSRLQEIEGLEPISEPANFPCAEVAYNP